MTDHEPLESLFRAYDSAAADLQSEYLEFLRIPSVSAETKYRDDVNRGALWVESFLKDAGMSVEIWRGSGHPTVFAEWLGAGTTQPTLLIYNHYDVQPVDPIALWTSPPFEPTVQGNEVFARGAQDNKGQCFYVMAAVRWWLKSKGRLPINIKLCIEGEEETGSESLAKLLAEKSERLKADYLYIVDLGIHEVARPALTLGVRGIVTMTVELRGSNSDLHSGMVGGMMYNPNRALSEMLSKLYTAEGRVAVPGFYDRVNEIPDTELQAINFEFDEPQFEKMFGAKPIGGEKAFTPMQRAWVRPTVEINGMWGGYTGDGFKTVIPAQSNAKISCRLVADQDPQEIASLVKQYLEELTPAGMTLNVKIHAGSGRAVRTRSIARPIQVTAEIISEIFGKPCEFILSGGSIPIIAELARAAHAEVVMLGYGLPDDNIHAPNEHFGLDRIRNGFVTIAASIDRLANR